MFICPECFEEGVKQFAEKGFPMKPYPETILAGDPGHIRDTHVDNPWRRGKWKARLCECQKCFTKYWYHVEIYDEEPQREAPDDTG